MRVLVVEDNRNLMSNLFEYFEPLGHTLDAAPMGHRAALGADPEVTAVQSSSVTCGSMRQSLLS